MESRTFIREATVLAADIKKFGESTLSHEEEQTQGTSLQKRVNTLFLGLQNPTLPSAGKLRDAATRIGFHVDPRAVAFLSRGDSLWSF